MVPGLDEPGSGGRWGEYGMLGPVQCPDWGSKYLVAAVQVLQVLRLRPQEGQASLGP